MKSKTEESREEMSKKYEKVAESLGVHYLFGRWGFVWGSKSPGEKMMFRPRFIPLDGWITKKECVVEEMLKRDMEL